MKIYDVSLPLSPRTPIYPGDPETVIDARLSFARGDGQNLSYLGFGSHTGTHVDAPFHFFATGLKVHELSLELLMGRTRVIEIASGDRITAETLEEHDLGDVNRVLFKTRNSYLWETTRGFVEKYVHLTPDAAVFLVKSGIKVVGIDYLSVEPYDYVKPEVHLELLGHGVIIIEGLDLREVEPGDYEMICLPLKIEDGDGAPARVVLRR
ncbi:MAG: cyclase family protein [Acidobacteria bacterium]|nr:cyclase family protein [Acidobacteriota bacterium]